MRRSVALLAVLFTLVSSPFIVAAQDATPAPDLPGSACAAPDGASAPETASPVPVPNDETALAAIELLPLDALPATVSRADGAEHGDLSLSLPGALSAIKLSAKVESDSAGPIGTVDRVGNELVFSFDEVTYQVEEISLPIGGKIAPQAIKLDPSQPSTLCVDLTTGKITRNFHWLMTGSNVLYDGLPSIPLGDRGKATIAAITKIDEDHYTIHLMTHWQSEFELKTWSLGGVSLPSGAIKASAEFDGLYTIDFSN